METLTEENSQSATLKILDQEQGLARQLNARQLAMIAIGGAIGTGLFLGSALAVRLAGPAVIVTYCMGAFVALLLMGALSEMAVAHPTAGSFGVYAELYLSKWSGFAVRYTYWMSQTIAVGGEAVAVAVYCNWWFPHVPQWIWIVSFSSALIFVNTRSVGKFGEFEYWFSMIKVVAIVLFVAFGLAVLMGVGSAEVTGTRNLTMHGGFFPHGFKGAWMALVFVIFSFIGTEVVAVTAGEAKDPDRAVPKAMRSMIVRLIIFYVAAISVLVAIIPWNQIQPGSGITASPFVTVFQWMGIPAAAHIVNFVVLTAALSSMNCNLYMATRMLFSLARGGYAPKVFGVVSSKGTPTIALLVSGAGLFIATTVNLKFQSTAYVYMFGIALFGGLFVWLMIFLTHLAFRQRWKGDKPLPIRMIGYPYTSILGALLLVAILITSYWVEGMRVTLTVGIPWLVFLSLGYMVWMKTNSKGKPEPG